RIRIRRRVPRQQGRSREGKPVSESTAREERRAIRRAVGERAQGALDATKDAIRHLQHSTSTLAQQFALDSATIHRELDRLEEQAQAQDGAAHERMTALFVDAADMRLQIRVLEQVLCRRSFWQRLRWVLRGK